MAIKLIAVCLFFAAAVISPLRLHYTGVYDDTDEGSQPVTTTDATSGENVDSENKKVYLWSYVAFVYAFTFFAAFFLLRQTHHIVKVRQKYLGSQNSITDRTIRLSGVPPELRDPDALKEHIETLGIGQVTSVTICKHWKELDKLMERRKKMLSKVERAWTEYLGNDGSMRSAKTMPIVSSLPQSPIHMTDPNDDEHSAASAPLLAINLQTIINGTQALGRRPLLRIGLFGWFGKHVDKIDYYTVRLEAIDQKVKLARHREYKATPVAFVTMDSVASAQMAAQAVLDPQAFRLIAHIAPAPHDVIWPNLYKSRFERSTRQWMITAIMVVATVSLFFPVGTVSAFLQPEIIEKVWPALARVIASNKLVSALITGFLPTFLITLLNVLVPFLYNWLSNLQGYISHGDVELSVIGKNFFYIFFHLFLVFTLIGTASFFWTESENSGTQLASALHQKSTFYIDLIILQGIGMIPFRLLEFGVVFKYPFLRIFSKTPRDYYNLYKPPNFNYGFFLPQPIFILIICLCYSCMSTKILSFGLIYFILGSLTFKYQLLYSMSHTQHSTGKSWPMIFYRVCIGLLIFQLFMASSLITQKVYYLAGLLTPLPILTLIMMYNFYDHYRPLSNFIALRAIKQSQNQAHLTRTLDEERERNQVYINPNLICPLEEPWIADRNGQLINVQFV